MLPASSSNAGSSRTNFGKRQIALACGLMLYVLAVGVGLLGNIIRPERAYLLMAAPCLVPLLWYAFGYLRSRGERDSGLLLSAVGWLLITLALVSRQIAVARAGDNLSALQASTPLVPIFATFGVLSLLAGAIFSWLTWASREESSAPSDSAHY